MVHDVSELSLLRAHRVHCQATAETAQEWRPSGGFLTRLIAATRASTPAARAMTACLRGAMHRQDQRAMRHLYSRGEASLALAFPPRGVETSDCSYTHGGIYAK